MIHDRQRQLRGFTLLELLVVIAILGILATIVIVSTSSSRQAARNAQTISQIEEYKKAVDLFFLEEGRVPQPWADQLNNAPNNVCIISCFGDGVQEGEDCLAEISYNYDPDRGEVVSDALGRYMNSQPRHNAGSYSGPAYSACISNGPGYAQNPADNLSPNEAGYRTSHYSLWFVLEGSNQDCAEAVSVTNFSGASQVTLCRLMVQ